MSSPRLICLVSVRNGAGALPSFLYALAPLADAVVALDDGSTDDTGTRLAEHPIVRVVLANPRRDADDGAPDPAGNTNRMLAAARILQPDWVLLLNVDEYLDAHDTHRLRIFLDREAVKGFAYGFQGAWTRGSTSAGDDGPDAVGYRLFSYREGARVSPSAPTATVPTDLPRGRWIPTTLHIRQGVPPDSRPAAAGSSDQPVVPDWTPYQGVKRHISLSPLDPTRPALSAVVIAQNDLQRITAAMDALTRQAVNEPTEIILVDSGSDQTARFVRERYPSVRVIHLDAPALPGRARNAGLWASRGDFVTFPGSHVVVGPDFLQRRIDAHALGYALVSGQVRNGTPSLSGWASYFLDHGTALPGRPSGELDAPPLACSYLREPLVMLGGFPEDVRAGEDTVVNRVLFDLGYRAYHAADVSYAHHSPCTNPTALWRHHYLRGVAYGRMLRARRAGNAHRRSPWRTLGWLVFRYPPRRLALVAGRVARWGRRVRLQFILSLPLQIAGIVAATAGAVVALVRSDTSVSPAPPSPSRHAVAGQRQ